MSSAPEPTSGHHTIFAPRWLPWALFALAVGTFALSWWGTFILDDTEIIQRDARIHSPDQWHRLWTRSYWDLDRGKTLSGWRPLTSTTFAVNWLLAGDSAWSYHLVNTTLHGLVTLAVFALALEILGALWPAAFAAALFAVHPMHSEAVINIVGRSELLATLFALMAWIAHRQGHPVRAALCLLLGTLSKETALGIVGVIALDDALRGELGQRPVRAWAVRWGPVLLAAALYLALRWAVLGNAGGGERIRHLMPLNPLLRGDVGLIAQMATAVKMLGHQWWLFLWPARLAMDHSWRQVPLSESFLDPPVAASLLVFAALGLVALSARRRSPAMLLGLGFWFLTALMTSNLILVIGVLFAERFMYLPSVGMCLVAGCTLAWVLQMRGKWIRSTALIVCTALLVAGVARSVRRTWDWNDRLRFWEHEVRTSPSGSQAWSALGVTQHEAGQLEQARRSLWRAIELSRMPGAMEDRPTHLPALRRLPSVLLNMMAEAAAGGDRERVEELGEELDRAIALCLRSDPTHAPVLSHLGLRLLARGEPGQAEQALHRALAIDDTDPVVLCNWADFLIRVRRTEEAIEILERAIALHPDAPIFQALAAQARAGRPSPGQPDRE